MFLCLKKSKKSSIYLINRPLNSENPPQWVVEFGKSSHRIWTICCGKLCSLPMVIFPICQHSTDICQQSSTIRFIQFTSTITAEKPWLSLSVKCKVMMTLDIHATTTILPFTFRSNQPTDNWHLTIRFSLQYYNMFQDVYWKLQHGGNETNQHHAATTLCPKKNIPDIFDCNLKTNY